MRTARRGVPERLEDATWTGPVHQIAPGRLLFDLPSVARVLLVDSEPAAVQAAPGASDADLAWLLSGPIAALERLRRGRFGLRAAGVVIGGRAVAIAGAAASGKSAAAAAIARRGHPVLADGELEISVIDGPVAVPRAPRLELWPDVVELLALDPAAGVVVRPALAKRAHLFAAAPAAPLSAVLVLSRETGVGDPVFEPILGRDRLDPLFVSTAGFLLIDPLGLRAAHFAWCAGFAGAIEMLRMRVDRHRRDLDEVATAIEGLMDR